MTFENSRNNRRFDTITIRFDSTSHSKFNYSYIDLLNQLLIINSLSKLNNDFLVSG